MEEEEEELVPNFLADTKYLEDYTHRSSHPTPQRPENRPQASWPVAFDRSKVLGKCAQTQ
jgi:hypothetical protein